MLEQIVLVVHVLVAIAILALIMLQQGKGAEMGASFGGGSSQTVFGVQGSGNLLTRWTAVLAAVFFVTSLTLAYFAREKSGVGYEVEAPVPAAVEVMQPVNDEIPALTVDKPVAEQSGDVPSANGAAAEKAIPAPAVEKSSSDKAVGDSQPGAEQQ